MPANLNLNADIAAVKTAAGRSALDFINELLHLLDKAFRSSRNPFGSASLLSTGTTQGAVPLIGTGGKLASSVMPLNIPAANVAARGADRTFQVSQIPTVYANKTTGVFSAARFNAKPGAAPETTFGGLPATKLNNTNGPIPADKLPVGYVKPQTWPSAYEPGGPGGRAPPRYLSVGRPGSAGRWGIRRSRR